MCLGQHQTQRHHPTLSTCCVPSVVPEVGVYLTVRGGEAVAYGGWEVSGGPTAGCAWIAPSGSQRVAHAAESTSGLLPRPDADPWAPPALCTQPGRVGVLEVLSTGTPLGIQVPWYPSALAFATKQRKSRGTGSNRSLKTTKGTNFPI